MEIKQHEIHLADGCPQRILQATVPDFRGFRFLKPKANPAAFDHLCDLYRDFIVPRFPLFFRTLVFFRVRQGRYESITSQQPYGECYDSLVSLAMRFRHDLIYRRKAIAFRNEETQNLFEKMQKAGDLRIIPGGRPGLQIMPVSDELGFLSESAGAASLRCNAHFFVMDTLDAASVYDVVGTPVGLALEKGQCLHPPLFQREAFLVDENGASHIVSLGCRDVTVWIDGIAYRHGENAVFFSRPENTYTPKGGTDFILVNEHLVGWHAGGHTPIPASGFVVHTDQTLAAPVNKTVRYQLHEPADFGLQVGNSAMVKGQPTERFTSYFHHLLRFWTHPVPPSMYPLNYQKDRAPRMVLGMDANHQAVLLWFEGAGKFGYDPKKDSAGVSLKEAADFCASLGLVNAVHLDGGGSAQLLVEARRLLKLSDRNKSDTSEKERAVPLGLAYLGETQCE